MNFLMKIGAIARMFINLPGASPPVQTHFESLNKTAGTIERNNQMGIEEGEDHDREISRSI